MHRRYAKKNIPIELLRALVTVVDTRSYTKSGDILDLTQSAISAQINRLARLLGGRLFAKGEGLTLTDRGLLALQYARRVLALNDELLALAGPNTAPRRLIVGLPSWMGYDQLIATFQGCAATPAHQQVSFRCERSERLIADLNAGSVDIAYLCNITEPPGVAVAQFAEPMVWAKSPRLVLGAGAPIPLVSGPGTHPDRLAVSALQERGMSFFVAFSAPDFSARLAGVAAGFGVMAIPVRSATPEMEILSGELPDLPPIKGGIFAREGLDLRPHSALLRTLTETLAPRSFPEAAVAASTAHPRPTQRRQAALLSERR